MTPTDATAPDLPRLLRDLRRRHARRRGAPELTYREMAGRTGWSVGVIAGYFSGAVLPPTNRFDVLVTLLDASPAERGSLATVRDTAQENRRSRRVVPHQVPAPPPRFTGRDRHLRVLDEGRTHTRTYVLSGPPGVGKSALAAHWAHRVRTDFPGGRLHVDLRGFHPERPSADPHEVLGDLLAALGVPSGRIPVRAEARVALYRSLLADRPVLLVLDDAEDEAQVRPLLPAAPGCVTVVTSRNPLAGLVAREDAEAVPVAPFTDREARDLLARRLGARRAGAEPAAVDTIAERCARLPLALVVAAARACAHPSSPLAALAARLRDLSGFADTDPASDLRTVFGTSMRRVGPAAARLFARLGRSTEPETTAAIAARLTRTPEPAARDALAELTRVGLVSEHAPGRWHLNDLLKAYAAAALEGTDAFKIREGREGSPSIE